MVKRVLAVVAIALVAVCAATTASAQSDAVVTKVSIPAGQPVPVSITENGNPYANGTYAIGTVQLNYVITAFTFPSGTFATFNLDLAIKEKASQGTATSYPVQFLTLKQVGSEVNVVPATDSFEVAGRSWTAGTSVAVSIPEGSPQADGTELTGHLQFEAPGNQHLKTTTTIIIHIRLVHPTACLRIFDFVTDEELTTTVTSTNVNVNTKGKVTSTNPFGQLSNNVLIVNTCPVPKTVGLLVALDPWFGTNPSGNPGNAVFTYLASGSVEPDTFNIASFGTGTPQGQSLQMTGLTIPANETFLMTVHMAINKGVLWNGGASGTFTFGAQLSEGAIITNALPALVSYTMK